ncbi:NAD(P)-binding protein [Coniophora puteana RWD-64-598 SS2]|uniref:Arsenite methyltransferase n=1 Tax=Coniophora puteana (strain RWD-64-598) TaxID=741705 RepID=A0A5M3MMM6_CONPW|nr:NAD(P)-binding protein [Coniophora puteana RWD-64-598 SS2]EIW80452.1 NAD(P)-binding protein [Coniophora puteana RWD-64-598 SS2]
MSAGAVLPSSPDEVVDAVRNAYGTVAKEGADRAYADTVAQAFGYTAEQLQSVPEDSHMGLSCGNPVATASIREGENVIDLGSGGGVDVFLAAAKAGPTGQVVGLDMSPDMIALARRNAAKRNLKPPRVSFVKTLLHERLPINSDSVDCVLSNCVINLLPTEGKANLLKEVYRVLKPGGRVVLDDIIAKKEFTETLRVNLQAYVGCVSGALQLHEYREIMQNAGFQDAVFVDTKGDLNAYTQGDSIGCCAKPEPSTSCSVSSSCQPASCGPSSSCKPTSSGTSTQSTSTIAHQVADVNEWAASYQIYATKQANASASDGDVVSTAVPVLESWKDAYPTPKSSPRQITAQEVAELLKSAPADRRAHDFAVIDVRRDDHAGGHVRGSYQRAAQSFYDDLPEFLEKFKETNKVIFYCGSSSGRGPLCAAWYQDYLNEHGIGSSEALVMAGGAKAWLAAFAGDEALTDQEKA